MTSRWRNWSRNKKHALPLTDEYTKPLFFKWIHLMRRQIVIGWVIVSSITEGDLQEESEGRRRCSPIDSWSLQRRVGRGGRMCSICYQWWSKKRWLANLGRHSLLLIRSLERRWGTQNCNEAVLVGNGELHNRDVVRKDGPGSITFSLLKGYGEEQRKLIRMYLR